MLDHKANQHGSEMIQTPSLEMSVESLMRNTKKVGELLRIIEAKEMSEGKNHDDLKGNRVAFSKLTLKMREKPGKFLLPHGMPSDDETISIFIEGNP